MPFRLDPAVPIVSLALLLAPSLGSGAARRRVDGVRRRCPGKPMVVADRDDPRQRRPPNLAWRVSTGEADSAHAHGREDLVRGNAHRARRRDVPEHADRPRARARARDGTHPLDVRPADRPFRRRTATSPAAGSARGPTGKARPGPPCARRIIVATIDGRLIALDAARGTPCAGFGKRGTVDLRRGLRNPPFEPGRARGDVAAGGGERCDRGGLRGGGQQPDRRGERRGARLRRPYRRAPLDLGSGPAGSGRSGVARPGKATQAHRTGGANAWSVIAADPARDLVFVPDQRREPRLLRRRAARPATTTRTRSSRSGHPPGRLDLALPDGAPRPLGLRQRIAAGARHHPAGWARGAGGRPGDQDRDALRAAPRDGRAALSGGGAAGAGEHRAGRAAWPTQPFSTLPALSPHARLHRRQRLGRRPPATALRAGPRSAALRNEGIFTPPSLEGTLARPSNIGGAHWGGVAYDPEREIVVVPVNTIAAIVQLIPAGQRRPGRFSEESSRLGYQLNRMQGTPYFMRRRLLLGPSRAPVHAAAVRQAGCGQPADRPAAVGRAARVARCAAPSGGAARRGAELGSPNLGRSDRHRRRTCVHRGHARPSPARL